MIKENVTVVNKAGLHARAASRLAEVCTRFDSDIRIGKEKMVDGKSILSLMMLAASKGTVLNVVADGNDEAEAVRAISQLVANRFEEDE